MVKSISTHIRLRGLQASDGRVEEGGVAVEGNQVSVVSGQRSIKKTWTFDACHAEHHGQEDVFDRLKPSVECVLAGKNATIIAYGVTGSGKTYTMEGTPDEPGVIRRSVHHLLDKLDEQGEGVVSVQMSFLEILKDQVYDLLSERAAPPKLAIKTDASGNNVIDGLSKRAISSLDVFERVFSAAARLRKTASTKLNTQSSRSHAVLTVYTSVKPARGGPAKEGQLWLADLAGSEKNTQTGNTAERMQESKSVNSSLTTLSRVMDAIRNKAKVVPYRDCKLTRILQPALGGMSKAVLICCLPPGAKFTSDVVNTLDFADRTKQVEDVSVFVDPENRRLSMPLARSRPGTATGFRLSLAPSSGAANTIVPSLGQSKTGLNLPAQKWTLGDITNRRHSYMPGAHLKGAGWAVQEKGSRMPAGQEIMAGKEADRVVRIPAEGEHEVGAGETAQGLMDCQGLKGARQPSIADLCDVVQVAIDDMSEEEPGSASSGIHEKDTENGAAGATAEEPRLTEEERDAKARAYVKEARKHQTDGNLELARKLYIHAKPYIKDTRTVTKRIYALEAEIVARSLAQQARSSRPKENKRANEDVDMDGSGTGDVTLNPSMAGWRVATLRDGALLADMPSPAKRSRV